MLQCDKLVTIRVNPNLENTYIMNTVILFAVLIAAVIARFWAGWHYSNFLDTLPKKEREAWLSRARHSGV